MASGENETSKVFTILETFGNIFFLNILFILCSLPIITIGASTTATYSVMMKIVRNEEGTVGAAFFRSFKENFKQATLTWLMVLGALFIIYGELVYVTHFEGPIVAFYTAVIIIELVLLAFTLPFLFPLIARYKNGLFATIKNAFLLSVGNFGSWLKIFLAWFVPLFVMYYEPDLIFYIWYLWLIIIFGLIFFGTSFTLRKVFDKIANVQKDKKPVEDSNEEKKKIVQNNKKKKNKKSLSERMNSFENKE